MSDELDPQSQVTPGPGGKLALERERQNKSREQVASALNIQLDKIVALESDQYEKLFSAVFTRGYLRSYGKYLGLDGEALVREYEANFAITEEPLAPSESLNVKMSAGRSVWPARLVLILVLLALLGGVYWYVNSAPGDAVAQRETPPGTEPTSVTNSANLAVAAGGDSTNADNASADYTPAIELAAATSEANAPEAPAESLVLPSDSVQGETDQGVTPATEAQEPAAVVSDMSIGTTSSADGTILDELVLRFDNECWLEVLDSNGDSLAADLQREDSSITLHGVAPFNVKLGNPAGVEIALNGDEVAVPDTGGADKVVRFDVYSEI